ncbi:hypothetical protein KIN20_016768 [Parelaphostrongylus tenuis]|uniref:Uncharacterized protein n=1 Tax=Parelaphostrongylus tenuis TaxID=148309 RepID=A0AAD5N2A2_PARTN|nr:hypothetical protein KIN20_016768 [Parelaphostrongylus tenuis]
MISLLVTISTVFGCGVMPAGRESTRIFNVTGFTLPVSMVYATTTDIQAQIPGIASSKEGAQAFVSRLVMQTVFDVLERQARSALLPDAAISAILGQIEIKITYEPLQCQQFIRNPMDDDHKRHYGELVENDVAECSEQSRSKVGIASIWIAFLFCSGHYQRKLKLIINPITQTAPPPKWTTENIITIFRMLPTSSLSWASYIVTFGYNIYHF